MFDILPPTSARPAAFRHLAGKRVFLTGNTGFKGSWMSLWLTSLGAEVTGYSLAPPTEPANYDVCGIGRAVHRQHEADVRDLAWLREAMAQSDPDLVIHLAAQSVVRDGYESPHETFQTNVMGTVNVLESVRQLERPLAVLCVTSDKCYENREQTWGYRECDAMGEHDPYGGSKGAAELAIRAYRESFFPVHKLANHGVRLASARAGNVIGGGDWTPHALIVDIVKSIADGRPVQVRSPGAFRPWQHVLQCLSGYLTICSKLLGDDPKPYCEGWNIGPQPGNEIPVRDVVEAFLKAWGEGRWEDASSPDHVAEANVLRLSIDKALWELGWKPMWSVDEAIAHTADWYRQYKRRPDQMQDYSLQQIKRYEHAMLQAESRSPTRATVAS